MSFSIKLQKLNLNVCKKYYTERKAQGPNRTERDVQLFRSATIESRDLGALKFPSIARDEVDFLIVFLEIETKNINFIRNCARKNL